MPEPVVPFPRSDAILTVFVAASGEINGAILHLFDNDFTPTPDSVIGDFTEATFAGYVASSAIAWSEPFRTEDGRAKSVGDTKVFELDTLPGAIIYGWYATVGGALRAAKRFDTPVSLAVVGNACIVTPEYFVPFN